MEDGRVLYSRIIQISNSDGERRKMVVKDIMQ